MAELVRMTQLSPTMEEGRLVAWLKKEGESVETGDLIAEVETDKATMEMESYHDGVILAILVAEGDAIEIGAPMAVIGEKGESWKHLLEGGDAPKSDAPRAEASAPASKDDSGGGAAAAASAPAPSADASTDRGDDAADRRVRSSPLARKKAEDLGVDLRSLQGSGPAGRIVAKDVEAAASSPGTAAASASSEATSSAKAAAPAPRPAAAPDAESHTVSLSPMRRAIARNLTQAWQAPAFMLTRELDAGPLLAFRAQINQQLAAAGRDLKLSVNDLLIKAAARALLEVPEMNSAYEETELRLFHHAHIGIAVAVEGGLVTPVIRYAERRSLGEIATDARELAQKARDRKLKPEEFDGATFLISNLGMFGIDHFTAVLGGRAAGILAVGQASKKPVVLPSGDLGVGDRMTVTLTCDHRAVDGAVGAVFLQKFVERVEAPVLLAV